MTNSINIPLRSNEAVREAVRGLLATKDMTWVKMSEILGVPAGTLWDVAHGKPVPRKWRHRLGLRRVKDLYAMPTKELRWALDNRTEYRGQ